jgi:hypothetical protein
LLFKKLVGRLRIGARDVTFFEAHDEHPVKLLALPCVGVQDVNTGLVG